MLFVYEMKMAGAYTWALHTSRRRQMSVTASILAWKVELWCARCLLRLG